MGIETGGLPIVAVRGKTIILTPRFWCWTPDSAERVSDGAAADQAAASVGASQSRRTGRKGPVRAAGDGSRYRTPHRLTSLPGIASNAAQRASAAAKSRYVRSGRPRIAVSRSTSPASGTIPSLT